MSSNDMIAGGVFAVSTIINGGKKNGNTQFALKFYIYNIVS
jgi:hypothetical protein